MPKGDGTGPQGQDPNIGKDMGDCRSRRELKRSGKGSGQERGSKRSSGKAALRSHGQDVGAGRRRSNMR